MGIDYSDIISGIYIFLLMGLCITSILVVIGQHARIKYLENKVTNYLIKL